MRIVFIGSVEFSWHCLKAMLEAHEEVVGLFSLDEKCRKGVSDYRSLSDLALAYNIPLFEFSNINSPDTVESLRMLRPDVIFVLGLSQILSQDVLEIPSRACIGSHPALLPRGRGRALIPWAILKGWEKTGLTLFYLDGGVDSGDILAQKELVVTPEETAATLYQKMVQAGVEIIQEYLPLLREGKAPRLPQDHSQATYCPKRTPEDGLIDWYRSTAEVHRLIRAVTHPYPGAYTYLRRKKLIIWEAWPLAGPAKAGGPGEVAALEGQGFSVSTGDGQLLVRRAQLEGEEETQARDLAQDHGVSVGEVLGAGPVVLEVA